MKNHITFSEITADMSEVSVLAMERKYEEVVKKLIKHDGLMAPDICYIALRILDGYSNHARNQISLLSDSSNSIEEANKFLQELQNRRS